MPRAEGNVPSLAWQAVDASLARELWGWCAVAVGALAVAGVFALLLALSRVPGVETVFPWPLGFFRKGLVIHVIFSFVVFFLAVFGGLLVLATRALADRELRWSVLGGAGVVCMVASLPLLFVPALLDRGEATLNNYVPAIIDPLYYGGLALMAAAVALPGVRLLANIPGRRWLRRPWGLLAAAMTVTYLIALASFATALMLLFGQSPSHAFHEELFWGGGHVLQILNTEMLLVTWVLLAGGLAAERAMAAAPDAERIERVCVIATLALLAVALLAPAFYLAYEPFVAEQTLAFTDLQYALGPAALAVALTIVFRPLPAPPRVDPAALCFWCSVVLFAVGGAFGLFVDGADTRTPAHYHGVIAAVTLAFMGVFYACFLPILGRPLPRARWQCIQIALFCSGQLTACVGLFLAGGFGAPRKAAGADQGLDNMGAVIGMAMNGVGALVAVVGGVMFIWMAGRALVRSAPEGGGQMAGVGFGPADQAR